MPKPPSAAAATHNLIQRAAAVTPKARRRLVVVLRETPLRLSTLDNLPAGPTFYAGPSDVDALADFLAGRVLDLV